MKLPLGYRYAATYAGIRKVEKDDLALIVSGAPAAAAGVFTGNRAAAAPVILSREHLADSGGQVGAVIINAGNANCATRTGRQVALASCRAVASRLKMPASLVLPASTGVIGVELPGSKIVSAVPRLAAALGGDDAAFDRVAQAILTTDLVAKTAFASCGGIRIAGMTKGSGMIQPRMATTLGFVMTDAVIGVVALRKILRRAIEKSFNRISVDGDTSTNDTVLLLANGSSGVRAVPAAFEDAVTEVLVDLAKQIVRDGEGAKKLVTIDVAGAPSGAAAEALARAIANSPLVKTAIAGADPNWGRILSAAANAGVPFNPSKVDITVQGVVVCKGGLAAPIREAEVKKKLEEKDVHIEFTIRGGASSTRFWTCDLTEEYIRINASYRT